MSHEFIETELQTSVNDLGYLSIRREGEGMKLGTPRRLGLGAPAPPGAPRTGTVVLPPSGPRVSGPVFWGQSLCGRP